jgi:hypothetical protein
MGWEDKVSPPLHQNHRGRKQNYRDGDRHHEPHISSPLSLSTLFISRILSTM